MKTQDKRRIQSVAERKLLQILNEKYPAYSEYILFDNVRRFITDEVSKTINEDEARIDKTENLSENLREIGIEIATNLLDGLLTKLTPVIGIEIKERTKSLRYKMFLLENLNDEFSLLESKINNNMIREMYRYWEKEFVIITPEKILSNEYYGKTQVITDNVSLAKKLSRLFVELTDAMSPFLVYRNRYEFYWELADSANNVIQTQDYRDRDVLNAVLQQAKIFTEKKLVDFQQYCANEKQVLHEASNFLQENSIGINNES